MEEKTKEEKKAVEARCEEVEKEFRELMMKYTKLWKESQKMGGQMAECTAALAIMS